MDFESIYQLYFKDVFLFLRSISVNEDIAEEITQETFTKALKAIDTFDGNKDIRAWLFTIAKNTYFSCKSESRSDKVKSLLLQIVSAAVIATVAELIGCDYGKNGVLFVIVFYIFRENRFYQILLFLVVYILVTNEQPTVYTLLSCLIILLYNGTRGKLKLKYSFYAFYPIHIAVLYLITLLLPRMFNCL